MPTKKKAVMPKPVLAAGRRRQKGKGIGDWFKKIKDGVTWFRDNVTKPSNITGKISGNAAGLLTKGLKSVGFGKRKTGGARKGKAMGMGGGSRTTGTMSF